MDDILKHFIETSGHRAFNTINNENSALNILQLMYFSFKVLLENQTTDVKTHMFTHLWIWLDMVSSSDSLSRLMWTQSRGQRI